MVDPPSDSKVRYFVLFRGEIARIRLFAIVQTALMLRGRIAYELSRLWRPGVGPRRFSKKEADGRLGVGKLKFRSVKPFPGERVSCGMNCCDVYLTFALQPRMCLNGWLCMCLKSTARWLAIAKLSGLGCRISVCCNMYSVSIDEGMVIAASR